MSDEELCENIEDEISDEEDDDSEGMARGGARPKDVAKVYVCADSSLKPSARLQLYDNQQWRIEVISGFLLIFDLVVSLLIGQFN